MDCRMNDRACQAKTKEEGLGEEFQKRHFGFFQCVDLYMSRFQNSNLKERGFSYPRKSNSSGGLESPPSVSFESAQGS
ncbi:MAG: hypothetical protein WCS96_00175, partial [Victivallales bacterium]